MLSVMYGHSIDQKTELIVYLCIYIMETTESNLYGSKYYNGEVMAAFWRTSNHIQIEGNSLPSIEMKAKARRPHGGEVPNWVIGTEQTRRPCQGNNFSVQARDEN